MVQPRRPPSPAGASASAWLPLDAAGADVLSRHPQLLREVQRLTDRAARASVLALSDRGFVLDLLMRNEVAAHGGRRESVLARAVGELHTDRFISDACWAELAEFFDDRELMELCMLVGGCRILAMCANTFAVEATT